MIIEYEYQILYKGENMVKEENLADKMEINLDKEDFSNWYNDVIKFAGLSDKRYPVKGMNVWTPYGWKIMLLIDKQIRKELDDTEHGEVCFPLLIPKTEFQKEADHIEGFDAQVFWVTKAGLNELDIPLLLRPTSETAMYPMFALWVRSHTDLPLKTYQLVNTFRYETKQTRSFIRVREIHFFEAHTCHADFEDAERQIAEDMEIMKKLADKLCIPYLCRQRPDWDKFAGAFYTIGIDCIMPTGRTLQLGSVHQYKTNFSVPYEIQYENADGEHKHVHQTTYGMSERLVGAVVGIHGDNKGLVLPPDVAPHQIVIVPILTKKRKDDVLENANKLKIDLKDMGYRVVLDDTDARPGSKFYNWELKGVPLRIEIGPRDIDKQQVVLARRTDGKKSFVKMDELSQTIPREITVIKEQMLKKATAIVEDLTYNVTFADEAHDVNKGLINVGWCGSEECSTEMELTLDMSMLGIDLSKDFQGKCGQCGAPATKYVTYARTY